MEYLNDTKSHPGFSSIRTLKAFSSLILECRKEGRINVLSTNHPTLKICNLLLSRPQSISKLKKVQVSDPIAFYDLICECKKILSLNIYVSNTDLLSSESLCKLQAVIQNLKS